MSVNGIDTSATPPETERQTSQNLEHVDLYIKAGQDGSCLGGCPFCQRVFMVLILKHEAGALTFTAHTVDVAHPDKNWKYGNQLPVFVYKDEVLTEVEEMIAYIDKTFPEPPFPPELPKANEACVNVFSKFNFYVKSQGAKGPEGMVTELRKLDGFLQESPHKFLCGDELSHLDCIMLPKLQHVRVVAKAFKDVDMPADMNGLWGYLGRCYEETAFKLSCPADQEIVYHWQGRAGLPPLSKEAAAQYRTTTTPRYSHDIPEELRPAIDETQTQTQTQNDVQATNADPPAPTTPTPMSPAAPDSPPAMPMDTTESKSQDRRSQDSSDAQIYENQDDVPIYENIDEASGSKPTDIEVPEIVAESQSAPETESRPKSFEGQDQDQLYENQDRVENVEEKKEEVKQDEEKPFASANEDTNQEVANQEEQNPDDYPIYSEVAKTPDEDEATESSPPTTVTSTTEPGSSEVESQVNSGTADPEPLYEAEPFPVT